jgi:hypothetical protein
VQDLDDHHDEQEPVDDAEEAAKVRPLHDAIPGERDRPGQRQCGREAEEDANADGNRTLDLSEQSGRIALPRPAVASLGR